ncbi:unnamed protein product [Larinioides sclopetarius]|uniref:Damage-specific DNA-binding protein 2 n=1 Tax=Larinioides sclopetarius TaxID=280406 RepID=A0AAV2B2L3_9ARAC
MAAEKRNSKQKTSNRSGTSSSESVNQKLRCKRKVESNSESVKNKHSSSKNNCVPIYGKEKPEHFIQSFDFSPLNYIKHFPLGQCSVLNLRKIGPGGSIVGLKFHQDDPSLVYTASITGDVRVDDFDGRRGKILDSTGCFTDWFSSLDVCYERKLLLYGNTSGKVYLKSVQGQKVWSESKCLHKKKVTHVEFSAPDPNIFVTASIDHSVKLWDIRMIGDSELKPNPICEFVHLKGVNSAYFSPTNRHSLLTTDQNDEIRVYKSSIWNDKLIINHPHRQFQHLTPIKATWHPLEDIVVVGRYPTSSDDNPVRCIDFFDGSTGKLLHRLRSPTGGILSLNAFNISGDCLASGTGSTVVFWKDKDVFDGPAFQKSVLSVQNGTSLI